MTDHYAQKACNELLNHAIPEAVEAYALSSPQVIARGLVDRMTSHECRVLLEQLVAERVKGGAGRPLPHPPPGGGKGVSARKPEPLCSICFQRPRVRGSQRCSECGTSDFRDRPR